MITERFLVAAALHSGLQNRCFSLNAECCLWQCEHCLWYVVLGLLALRIRSASLLHSLHLLGGRPLLLAPTIGCWQSQHKNILLECFAFCLQGLQRLAMGPRLPTRIIGVWQSQHLRDMAAACSRCQMRHLPPCGYLHVPSRLKRQGFIVAVAPEMPTAPPGLWILTGSPAPAWSCGHGNARTTSGRWPRRTSHLLPPLA